MHRGFRAFTHKLIYPFSHQRIYAHTQPFRAFVPGKSFSLGSQQVRPVSFEMHAADGDFIRDRHIAGRILRRIASDHSPVTVVILLFFLILYFLLNRRQNQMKARREFSCRLMFRHWNHQARHPCGLDKVSRSTGKEDNAYSCICPAFVRARLWQNTKILRFLSGRLCWQPLLFNHWGERFKFWIFMNKSAIQVLAQSCYIGICQGYPMSRFQATCEHIDCVVWLMYCHGQRTNDIL